MVALSAQLHRTGFARCSGVLSPEICDALLSQAFGMMAPAPVFSGAAKLATFLDWASRGAQGIMRGRPRQVREAAARRILPRPLTPTLRDALSAIAAVAQQHGICRAARLVELNFTVSLPGAARQGVHSDISPFHSMGPRVDAPLGPAPLCTVWAALQPTPAALGPTEIYAGSHHRAIEFVAGLSLHAQENLLQRTKQRPPPPVTYGPEGELMEAVPAPPSECEAINAANAEAAMAAMLGACSSGPPTAMCMDVGDVAIMDCRAFHCGGANRSAQTRVLLNASFQTDANTGARDIPGFT